MKSVLLVLPLLLVVLTQTHAQNPSSSDKADDEIFILVEQMPRFPGCEDMEGSNEEKKDCADRKLLQYIYGEIHYPSEARLLGIDGMAVVSFVVTHTGEIAEVEILRNPGGGLGEEAQRVVETMKDMPERWTPARHRGAAVNVKYNLPVNFKLSPSDKSKKEETTKEEKRL